MTSLRGGERVRLYAKIGGVSHYAQIYGPKSVERAREIVDSFRRAKTDDERLRIWRAGIEGTDNNGQQRATTRSTSHAAT